MKKILFMICALILCVACSHSTSSPPTTPVVTAPPAPTTVLVAKNNWSFTLPNKNWKMAENTPAGVEVALINTVDVNFILLVKEDFNGALDQYAAMGLQDLEDAGAVINSVTKTHINGNVFIVLDLANAAGTVKSLVWITVIDKKGHLFSCTSPTDHFVPSMCSNVASTLKIQ